MTPMEPIPETVQAVHELDPVDSGELLPRLTELANRAQRIVPDLVGASIARLEEGLTFTLVATAVEIAVLDGIQYAAGGPCVDGAYTKQVGGFQSGDVLDEDRWRLFAEATGAHAIRSTLTLPIIADERVAGTVNLYAASRRAFVGHHEELADVFGAWAAGAVANADLSFTTRRKAQAAARQLREQTWIDVAAGILSAYLGIDVEAAEDRLREAAARAGVSAVEIARTVVRAREQQDHDDR